MTDTTPDTTPEGDTASVEAAESRTAATDPAESVDAAGPTDTGDIGDSGDTETPPTNREARYRRRLRETEAERDQLVERLAVVQRGEAERLAAGHLADGADIWRDGAELAALLDEDGNVDPAKVKELATATAAAHPHWSRPAPPKGIRRNLNQSGATATNDRVDTSWSSVLRGANR